MNNVTTGPSSGQVSQVYNLENIITATPIDICGHKSAERYVVTFQPRTRVSYSIYKERLTWSPINWRWEHAGFGDPAYRSNYKAAISNMNFRYEGTGRER